jgi:hypothetical protein
MDGMLVIVWMPNNSIKIMEMSLHALMEIVQPISQPGKMAKLTGLAQALMIMEQPLMIPVMKETMHVILF